VKKINYYEIWGSFSGLCWVKFKLLLEAQNALNGWKGGSEHANSGHHLRKDGAVVSWEWSAQEQESRGSRHARSWSIPIRRNQSRWTEDDGNLVFERNLLTVFWLCTNVRVQSRYRIPSSAPAWVGDVTTTTTTTDDYDHFRFAMIIPITLIGCKSALLRHDDRTPYSQTMDLHNTKCSLSHDEGVFTLSSTCDIKCPNGGTVQNLQINVKLKSKSRQQTDQPTQPSGERVRLLYT